jgi:hypothetical protein
MKAWLALNERDTSPKVIIRSRAEPKLGKKEQALIDAKVAPHAGGCAEVVRHVQLPLPGLGREAEGGALAGARSASQSA